MAKELGKKQVYTTGVEQVPKTTDYRNERLVYKVYESANNLLSRRGGPKGEIEVFGYKKSEEYTTEDGKTAFKVEPITDEKEKVRLSRRLIHTVADKVVAYGSGDRWYQGKKTKDNYT